MALERLYLGNSHEGPRVREHAQIPSGDSRSKLLPPAGGTLAAFALERIHTLASPW
jgi:hypothetical protein